MASKRREWSLRCRSLPSLLIAPRAKMYKTHIKQWGLEKKNKRTKRGEADISIDQPMDPDMKKFFCCHEDCPQSTRGGFSSEKDRDRHQTKHNPTFPCEENGCDKFFSGEQNLEDHVRRIHKKSI